MGSMLEYKHLGKSGLKVSPLCLGTMLFGRATPSQESQLIIESARNSGIIFIDTADTYVGGDSERLGGRCIKTSRDHWVLATKLANKIIVAANIEAVSEALVLAKKAGLDPNTVFNAIKGGLAGSTVLNAKAPMMITGDFNPGFRIKLHQKDLHNALLTGKELGVPLPVTSLIQQMIGSLMNKGKGDLDHSAIANFLEDLAQIEIKE